MATRRAFITGLVSFVAAPAIVRVGSLMPVKVMDLELFGIGPAMYGPPPTLGEWWHAMSAAAKLQNERDMIFVSDSVGRLIREFAR